MLPPFTHKSQACGNIFCHATTIYTQDPSMWKCGILWLLPSKIKKAKEKDLTKFLGSCINFIWCHPGVPVSHNSFNIFQVALENLKTWNFQILPRYLGTEARNRSASLTYPSTSTNISLIFFFACKSTRLILFWNRRLPDLNKMLQRTMLLMLTPSSWLKHTVWTSRTLQATSKTLRSPQVRQVHTWRMV